MERVTHRAPAKTKYIVVLCKTNRDFGVEYKTQTKFTGVAGAVHCQNKLINSNPQNYYMIRVEYEMRAVI